MNQVTCSGVPASFWRVYAIYCPVGCDNVSGEGGDSPHLEVVLNILPTEGRFLITKNSTGKAFGVHKVGFPVVVIYLGIPVAALAA